MSEARRSTLGRLSRDQLPGPNCIAGGAIALATGHCGVRSLRHFPVAEIVLSGRSLSARQKVKRPAGQVADEKIGQRLAICLTFVVLGVRRGSMYIALDNVAIVVDPNPGGDDFTILGLLGRGRKAVIFVLHSNAGYYTFVGELYRMR